MEHKKKTKEKKEKLVQSGHQLTVGQIEWLKKVARAEGTSAAYIHRRILQTVIDNS